MPADASTITRRNGHHRAGRHDNGCRKNCAPETPVVIEGVTYNLCGDFAALIR